MPIRAKNIEDGTVVAAEIADTTITAAKLASNAVETAKIKDLNVTAAKLAADAVETAKIKDLNVTTAKLAATSVTTAKLGADAVDGTKVADDAIDSEHIAAGALDTEHAGVVAASGAGILLCARATTVSGTSTYDIFTADSPKLEIVDSWVIMDEGGSGTDKVKLTDGSNDITNDIDLSAAADNSINRHKVDDAYSSLTANSTLRVVTTNDVKCRVFVSFIKEA